MFKRTLICASIFVSLSLSQGLGSQAEPSVILKRPLSIDGRIEDTLTIEIIPIPDSGALESGAANPLSIAGLITENQTGDYLPDPDFCESNEFTYRVFDRTRYSPIYNVSLTVISTCDRPVATASSPGNSHTLYHLDRGCTDAKVGSGFNFEDSKGYLEVDVSGEPDLTSHASISFEFWIQPKILPTDFGNVARFGDPAFSGVAVFYERSLSTLLSPNKIRRIFNAGAAGKVIPPSNLPPIAEAGPDQTEPIHTRATLSGSGMDDGLSTGSTLS